MWGIIPGVIIVAGWFELLFVNGFGMPFNTGVVIYALLLIAGLTFGIRYTLKHNHTVVNTMFRGHAYRVLLLRDGRYPFRK